MDEMGRRAERILHGTGETTMSVTEEARRVLGQHMQSARKSWGTFTYCTCGQWKGHRDMYLAHMVDALAGAGVLAAPELPQAAAEPGATLAGRIRALGNTLVSDVKVDLGPLVREAERLEAQSPTPHASSAGSPAPWASSRTSTSPGTTSPSPTGTWRGPT